jgi:hypothetical protein
MLGEQILAVNAILKNILVAKFGLALHQVLIEDGQRLYDTHGIVGLTWEGGSYFHLRGIVDPKLNASQQTFGPNKRVSPGANLRAKGNEKLIALSQTASGRISIKDALLPYLQKAAKTADALVFRECVGADLSTTQLRSRQAPGRSMHADYYIIGAYFKLRDVEAFIRKPSKYNLSQLHAQILQDNLPSFPREGVHLEMQIDHLTYRPTSFLNPRGIFSGAEIDIDNILQMQGLLLPDPLIPLVEKMCRSVRGQGHDYATKVSDLMDIHTSTEAGIIEKDTIYGSKALSDVYALIRKGAIAQMALYVDPPSGAFTDDSLVAMDFTRLQAGNARTMEGQMVQKVSGPLHTYVTHEYALRCMQAVHCVYENAFGFDQGGELKLSPCEIAFLNKAITGPIEDREIDGRLLFDDLNLPTSGTCADRVSTYRSYNMPDTAQREGTRVCDTRTLLCPHI